MRLLTINASCASYKNKTKVITHITASIIPSIEKICNIKIRNAKKLWLIKLLKLKKLYNLFFF